MDNSVLAIISLILGIIAIFEPRATLWPKIRDWLAKRSIRTAQAQKGRILKEYKGFAHYHENGHAAILYLLAGFFNFVLHTWLSMILLALLVGYILAPPTVPPPRNIVEIAFIKIDWFVPGILAIGSFGFLSTGLLDIEKLTKHSYRLTHFTWYKGIMETRLTRLTGESTTLPDPKDIEPMSDPPV